MKRILVGLLCGTVAVPALAAEMTPELLEFTLNGILSDLHAIPLSETTVGLKPGGGGMYPLGTKFGGIGVSIYKLKPTEEGALAVFSLINLSGVAYADVELDASACPPIGSSTALVPEFTRVKVGTIPPGEERLCEVRLKRFTVKDIGYFHLEPRVPRVLFVTDPKRDLY